MPLLPGNQPKYHVYFQLTAKQLVMKLHGLMHDMCFGRYKTLNFNIEQTVTGQFTLIVIFSERYMTKKQLVRMLEQIPFFPNKDWKGGK